MTGTMMLRAALLIMFLTGISAAETHNFKPTSYTREFSAHIDPVLRIKPGDTVETTCVDSNGDDETEKNVTLPYNPLTGPFYVEGAEPGDTLVVHLEKIRLNRKTGVASSRISPAVVTADYIRRGIAGQRIIWNFDLESMTGSTDFSPRFQNFRLPLRPFLGCLGVAPPPRDAPYSELMARTASATSSITVDNNGGNLDYNRLVEGTTVYLPVSARGAYLFMGDGHAAQGDGETSGGAIETSMSVRFRVSLIKGKAIPAVRAETDEDYIALGMGRPLDDAMQRATVNMLHWLTNDFGLSPEEAHVMLGTSARFDITVVVGPRSAMACRLPKSLLSR